MTRTYTDLRRLRTLEERFDYLSLRGTVGAETFGNERWANQNFYRSREWRQIRDIVNVRDNGCDLGIEDFPVQSVPRIHHMNPLTIEDIEEASDNLLDTEGLITTALQTHNAIHFGDGTLLPKVYVERRPGDTQLWEPIGRIPWQ
jgi:hypothetical protein